MFLVEEAFWKIILTESSVWNSFSVFLIPLSSSATTRGGGAWPLTPHWLLKLSVFCFIFHPPVRNQLGVLKHSGQSSHCQPSSFLLTQLPLPPFPLPTNPFVSPPELAPLIQLLPPSIWVNILDFLFLLLYPNNFVSVAAARSLRPRFHCSCLTGVQPEGWRAGLRPLRVIYPSLGSEVPRTGRSNYIFQEKTKSNLEA